MHHLLFFFLSIEDTSMAFQHKLTVIWQADNLILADIDKNLFFVCKRNCYIQFLILFIKSIVFNKS